MPSVICLLRAVNVGGRTIMKMAQLKAVFEAQGFGNVQTVLQSGNVVFSTKRASLPAMTRTIAGAIAEEFGVTPDVILRTLPELRAIMQRNPFRDLATRDPSHLLVMFLAGRADPGAHTKLTTLATPPERFEIGAHEVYFHYANGVGRSKLAGAAVEKALGARGTARNWNTILKLLQVGETIE